MKQPRNVATMVIALLIVIPLIAATTGSSRGVTIVDPSAPVPLFTVIAFGFTVVFFILQWGVAFLLFRMQLRKHKRELDQEQKDQERAWNERITSQCIAYWTNEDFILKLERRIGTICERISADLIARYSKEIVTASSLEVRMKLVDSNMENMKLQMKNELLKEVLVIASSRMIMKSGDRET